MSATEKRPVLEPVDNVDEAESRLARGFANVAQVYATLALVERMERIGNLLQELVDRDTLNNRGY